MYKKAFQNLNNVTVDAYSPRRVGEQAKRSKWVEIALPGTISERINLVRKLSKKHTHVHFRLSVYGHARLFVQD
jgi:hypothetical protein